MPRSFFLVPVAILFSACTPPSTTHALRMQLRTDSATVNSLTFALSTLEKRYREDSISYKKTLDSLQASSSQTKSTLESALRARTLELQSAQHDLTTIRQELARIRRRLSQPR